MDIVDFAPDHVEPAADQFAQRYATLRAHVDELPAAWEAPSRIAPHLARIVASGPAFAAVDAGTLVGYLAGRLVRDHTGRPWIYVPEWAYGSGGANPRRAIEDLYAAAAPAWVGAGALTHRIGVLADDHATLEALDWLSFGHMVVDAVRPLEPLEPPGAGPAHVRRATVDDTDTIVALESRLRRHLQSSPTYLLVPPPRSRDAQRDRLVDRATATFIAEDDRSALAFLRIGPAGEDVATIVQDPGTASITGAYTVPTRRGEGIARALLDAALGWAREAGYTRCGVDFESMNVTAARFWTAAFTPVATTMTRTIDELVVAGTDS